MKNIITDFAAVPGTDCTAAFEAAAVNSGDVYVPPGQYILSGTSDACVVVTGGTRFVGEGRGGTEIIYTAPVGVDCFTFRPAPGVWCDGAGLSHVTVKSAGGIGGRYPVRIDISQPGSFFRAPVLSNLWLECGQGADAALKLDNPTNTDGFFCSVIEKSTFVGGINLVRCGDSVSILDCTLTGPNPGLYATFVPGAARLMVARCNITGRGGAAVLLGANQATVRDCQCEQDQPYNGAFNGQFILSNCVFCTIENNNINNHGNTNGIVLEDGTTYTKVGRNVMTTGGSMAHALIGPNSPTNAFGSSTMGSTNAYLGGSKGNGVPIIYASSPLWDIVV